MKGKKITISFFIKKKKHEQLSLVLKKNFSRSSVYGFESSLHSFPLENFQQSLNILTGGFMRKEPLNSTKLHEYPEVVAIFTRENWMPFFERIHGDDEEVIEEFLMSLRPIQKHML